MDRRLAAKVSSSEVTQATLALAAERFGDFRGSSVEEFRAWLITILENTITDQTRKFLQSKCRSVKRETSMKTEVQDSISQRPSQICSAQEQIARLLEVVETMPPDLRTLVRMRYQQDLTFHEIADVLNLPLSTVRRRWLSAVKSIERQML